jgi:hypothetical protein
MALAASSHILVVELVERSKRRAGDGPVGYGAAERLAFGR